MNEINHNVMSRFWDKVEKTNNCWMWNGAKTTNGYGLFWYDGKSTLTHRFIYELLMNHIPNNLTIDHLCRNRACVNPSHMEVVNIKENTRRGISKIISSTNSKKRHCKHGHEFTVENTYHYRNMRQCRVCHNKRTLRQYHEKAKEWLKNKQRIGYTHIPLEQQKKEK